MLDCLFVAINARYIHTNNAVRLLTSHASFNTDFIECTIHDSMDYMFQAIVSKSPLVVGFSCYIWNIEHVTALTNKLKKETNISVLLGGPEVSYDARHILDDTGCDMVVKGEGEAVIDEVLAFLLGISKEAPKNNVSFYHEGSYQNVPIHEISDLSMVKSPYYFAQDLPHLPHKIAYIETSRGCPYRCSYCLSSLENSVRFFPIDKVKTELLYLLNNGAKIFKFLDRTFNANRQLLEIIDFIVDHHQEGCVFQFEMTGDTLKKDILDSIHARAPKGLFRFEIGVQSINLETNRCVDRFQDTEALFQTITTLQQAAKVTLHLDLIAGLPKEDLSSFITTFNDVYRLGAEELQLGFLKFLKGTKIRNEASRYNYIFETLPPYEIISSDVLSVEDLSTIKKVETVLNIFHNKKHFGALIYHQACNDNQPFDYFLSLYKHMEKMAIPFKGYQRDDVFRVIDDFTDNPLIKENFRCYYLENTKVKPKRYFDSVDDREIKRSCFDVLTEKTVFHRHDFYKHSVVLSLEDGYGCFLYKNHQVYAFYLSKDFVLK